MKIIFLDFDGVLCNHESIHAGYGKRTSPEQDPYGAHSDCVAQLNRIIAETGAMIVVSSTWRRVKNPRVAMAETLKRWGVSGTVIDVTPYGGDCIRGDEIKYWLDHYTRHEIESFVILDDDSDMGQLRHRLVKCSNVLGLTEADADLAISMLKAFPADLFLDQMLAEVGVRGD